MEIIVTVIMVIGVLFIVLTLSSVLVLGWQWKYYRKVYKKLPYMKFKELRYKLHYLLESEDEQFIWFVNKDDFLLSRKDTIYLHNAWFIMFDPYSLYWWLKYRKYFDTHHLNKIK